MQQQSDQKLGAGKRIVQTLWENKRQVQAGSMASILSAARSLTWTWSCPLIPLRERDKIPHLKKKLFYESLIILNTVLTRAG